MSYQTYHRARSVWRGLLYLLGPYRAAQAAALTVPSGSVRAAVLWALLAETRAAREGAENG